MMTSDDNYYDEFSSYNEFCSSYEEMKYDIQKRSLIPNLDYDYMYDLFSKQTEIMASEISFDLRNTRGNE